MGWNKFSIADRVKSFGYAFNGLKILISEEHNSRVHIFAAICAVVGGFLLRISLIEWTVIVFAIGLVFALELINSAIENICDFVSPQKHATIKKVKDMAAAAVLVGTCSSLIIGVIIFLPKVIELF